MGWVLLRQQKHKYVRLSRSVLIVTLLINDPSNLFDVIITHIFQSKSNIFQQILLIFVITYHLYLDYLYSVKY